MWQCTGGKSHILRWTAIKMVTVQYTVTLDCFPDVTEQHDVTPVVVLPIFDVCWQTGYTGSGPEAIALCIAEDFFGQGGSD